MSTVSDRPPRVNGGQPKDIGALKASLKARGITYDEIARVADCSWHNVWMVVNGRRVSGPVMRVIDKLLGVGAAA